MRADPESLVYRILYRFLVPGWSAKPLVSAHDRIMGTHTGGAVAGRRGLDAGGPKPEKAQHRRVWTPYV